MNIIALILAFFRPGLDYASMGAGIFAGLEQQYGAYTAPESSNVMPVGMSMADRAWIQAMQAIQAATDRNTGMVDPVLLQSYSQLLGIDLTPLVTAGAAAGGQYAQMGQQGAQGAGSMMGAGSQILQTSMDPQNALYERGRQQATEGIRGAESSRGIAMGGQGAGLEADALRNYNMDWQDRQLGRQGYGASAAGQAYGGGMNLGGQAAQYTQMGGQAPVAGQMQAYGLPMEFSNQFLSAQNNMMQPNYRMQDQALNYMGYGTGNMAQQYWQDYARHNQQNQMMVQGQGMLNMGYDLKSGAGNPMSYMGMGGMGGGGGGGGGGMSGGYPG